MVGPDRISKYSKFSESLCIPLLLQISIYGLAMYFHSFLLSLKCIWISIHYKFYSLKFKIHITCYVKETHAKTIPLYASSRCYWNELSKLLQAATQARRYFKFSPINRITTLEIIPTKSARTPTNLAFAFVAIVRVFLCTKNTKMRPY